MNWPTDTRTAVKYGAAVGLAATVVVNGALYATGGISFPASSIASALLTVFFVVVFYTLGPTVVFGTPVALYLRLGLVTPALALAAAAGFWLFVGGNPRWVVLFVLLQGVPMAVIYAAVGTVEWYVRDRRGTLPTARDPEP
jgi:hypothetical protein